MKGGSTHFWVETRQNLHSFFLLRKTEGRVSFYSQFHQLPQKQL